MITNLLGLPGPGRIRVEWNTSTTSKACQVILVDGSAELERRPHVFVAGPSAQVESFEGLDRNHHYTVMIEGTDDQQDLEVTTT